MKRLLLAVVVLLLSVQFAAAATLYLTEYANVGSIQTTPTPWPPGPSLTTQQVAVGVGSVQSSAFTGNTRFILATCDIGCSIEIGSDPTAATTDTLLIGSQPYLFAVTPETKIAVIANSAGDVPGGTVTLGTCTPGAGNLCKAEYALAASGDSGVAIWCVQTAAPADAAGDGDYAACQMKNGALIVTDIPNTAAAAGITPAVTAAAGSSQVVCAAACNLYGFNLTSGASAGTIYVFNATALPSNGAVTPVKCYEIAANSSVGVGYDPPLRMSTGATVGFGTGTNCFSLTASTTAFISGEGR